MLIFLITSRFTQIYKTAANCSSFFLIFVKITMIMRSRLVQILGTYFLLILSLAPFRAAAAPYEYGLRIRTYPYSTNEQTALLLEGGKAIDLKGEPFRMDFELYNRQDNLLGTVFRIITEKGDNIDLMYSVDRNDNHYPILVTGEYVHDINFLFYTTSAAEILSHNTLDMVVPQFLEFTVILLQFQEVRRSNIIGACQANPLLF